jgi:hypothetical protein
MEDDGCITFLLGVMVVIIIAAFIAPLLASAILFLAQLTLFLAVIGAIGLLCYFVIRCDASRRIDAHLGEILGQIEGQESIQNFPALTARNVEWQESVLTGSEWGHSMTFVRETGDGEIRTTVRIEREGATVSIVLNGTALESSTPTPIRLEYLEYSNVGESASAARHVREWMRQRMLPELQAAKILRESESNRLAAEAAEIEAKRQEYRRKYLP